jgi:hypothetical protein
VQHDRYGTDALLFFIDLVDYIATRVPAPFVISDAMDAIGDTWTEILALDREGVPTQELMRLLRRADELVDGLAFFYDARPALLSDLEEGTSFFRSALAASLYTVESFHHGEVTVWTRDATLAASLSMRYPDGVVTCNLSVDDIVPTV